MGRGEGLSGRALRESRARPERAVVHGLRRVAAGPHRGRSLCGGSQYAGETARCAVANQHFWRGQPNLWQQLLTAREAIRIAESHQPFFETFGYACDPHADLTEQDAHANWYALKFASLKEECRLARSQVLKAQEDLRASDIAGLRSQVDELRAALSRLRAGGGAAIRLQFALSRLLGAVGRRAGRLLGKVHKSWRSGTRAVKSRLGNR